MRKTVRRKSGDQGVALVTTVIVVAVLAVVAVAFMQSTTVDRLSSRSVANYYRAKLAAEAGLAAASAAIATSSTNDTFIVVLNTNRQLFIGNGGNQPAGSFAYTPAFSTVNSVTSAVTPLVTSVVPATNPPAGPNTTNFTFTNLPGGLSVTSPPAISWVYLTTAISAGAIVTNARFAYWVEDLGGKLDLSVVGVANAGDPSARRPTGTNPEEIALWSVFNPARSSDPGNAVATSLVSARSNLLTRATARLVNAGVSPDFLRELATGLQHDTNEVETIPFGFGYSAQDQEKPKFNVNTNLTAAGGEEIVRIIQRNLPTFAAQRAGGRPPVEYLNHLAANIVDYADADPTLTGVGAQTGNEPAVYLNEIFDRYFYSENVNQGGQWSVKIQISTYMEFWNPTDKQVQGSLIAEIDATRVVATVSGADRPLATEPWVFEEAIDFRPNEYKVVEMSREVTLPWGPTAPPANATLPLPASEVNYSIVLDGNQVDRSVAGRGLERTRSPTGLRLGQPTWKGNAMVADSDLALGRVGDPRMNMLIPYQRRGHSYDNRSSWGGRNRMPALAEWTFGEVKKWLDGTFVTNSPAGRTPTSVNQLPPALAAQVAYYSNAPIRFNNSGQLTNIFELGHVFDPVQWNVNLTNVNDIPANALASNLGGGGNSLRVGRAEHPRFTNDGRRASQLLDLFAVGPTNSAGLVVNRTAGRININTADTNALRALVAGVFHQSDPAMRPANLVVPTNAVAGFVGAVERFRSGRPFFAPSQLTLMATNNDAARWPTNAVFGNRALVGATEWDDSAAEEWFAKIYSLSTVRSRNFIVYVVGQALQPDDASKPISTARSAYQIYVEPMRNPQGVTTNAIVRVLKSWTL